MLTKPMNVPVAVKILVSGFCRSQASALRVASLLLLAAVARAVDLAERADLVGPCGHYSMKGASKAMKRGSRK